MLNLVTLPEVDVDVGVEKDQHSEGDDTDSEEPEPIEDVRVLGVHAEIGHLNPEKK